MATDRIQKAISAYYEDLTRLRGSVRLIPHREATGSTKDLLSSKSYFTPCLEHTGIGIGGTPVSYVAVQECPSCYQNSLETWLAKGYLRAKERKRFRYKPWYELDVGVAKLLFPHRHQGGAKVGACCWQAAWQSWQESWGNKP